MYIHLPHIIYHLPVTDDCPFLLGWRAIIEFTMEHKSYGDQGLSNSIQSCLPIVSANIQVWKYMQTEPG